MTRELLYTSAPRGLMPGSQGFCTVAATRGLSATWREALEGLSAYRPLFPPDDPRNPVVFAHMRVTAGGAVRSVLSRIGPAGLDYSGRTNKLAHHLILEPGDRPAAGPAWLLARPGLIQTAWDGQIEWREAGPELPNGPSAVSPCRTWERLTGDAGWAGALAEASVDNPRRPAVLVFSAGTDLLPLIAEALLLIPPARRWDVTFSTYFTAMPPTAECLWRGVVAGTPEAKAATRLPGAFVLDLTAPLSRATGGSLVEVARTGRASARPFAGESAAAPAWDVSRPVPSAVPPVPRLDDLDWPGAEAAIPSRLGPPPPPQYALPGKQRNLAVWLVLFAVVIGGAGVGGALMWQQKQESGSEQSRPASLGLRPGEQAIRTKRWNELRDRALKIYGIASNEYRAVKRWKPWPDTVLRICDITEEKLEKAGRLVGTALTPSGHQPAEGLAVSPEIAPPVSSEPALIQVPFLERYVKGKQSHQSINIGTIATSRIRFIPSKASFLVPDTRGPSPTVTITAHKDAKPEVNTRGFDRQFAQFRLTDGVLEFEVLDGMKDEGSYWRMLFDSVLEITDKSQVKCRVAMRERVSGGYDWRSDASIRLKWGEYDGWGPTQNVSVRSAEISRTVKVKQTNTDEKGKPKDSYVDQSVREKLTALSADKRQAKVVSKYDGAEITMKFSSEMRADITMSNGPVNRDDVKLVGLELYEVVNGIEIPVFGIKDEHSLPPFGRKSP